MDADTKLLIDTLELLKVAIKTGPPEYDERDWLDMIDTALKEVAAQGKQLTHTTQVNQQLLEALKDSWNPALDSADREAKARAAINAAESPAKSPI